MLTVSKCSGAFWTHLQLREGHHHVLSVALERCAGVSHQEQLL